MGKQPEPLPTDLDSTAARDELQELHLCPRESASGISHEPHLKGKSNRKTVQNVDWKCNTKVCGLADMRSVAAREESSEATKKLSVAVCFFVVFSVLEFVGSIEADSLAIRTDALSLSTDVASFAVSLFAVWAGGWEADDRHTFGFYRAEVLGDLIFNLFKWSITVITLLEAVVRLFSHQAPVDGRLMFIVASLGLVVNLVMMLLLGHDHDHGKPGTREHTHTHGNRGCKEVTIPINVEEERPFERKRTIESTSGVHELKCLGSSKTRENVNVKSAYLGDLVQSIGVMVGGAVIWWKPEWMIVDLICTFLLSILALLSTVKMVGDVLPVLMESIPRGIDAKALKRVLVEIDGVIAVHDFHIWAITVGKVVLACHVTIEPEAESDEVLKQVISCCDSGFKISHVTIQIERERHEQETRQHYPSEGHGHDHDHHHGDDDQNHDTKKEDTEAYDSPERDPESVGGLRHRLSRRVRPPSIEENVSMVLRDLRPPQTLEEKIARVLRDPESIGRSIDPLSRRARPLSMLLRDLGPPQTLEGKIARVLRDPESIGGLRHRFSRHVRPPSIEENVSMVLRDLRTPQTLEEKIARVLKLHSHGLLSAELLRNADTYGQFRAKVLRDRADESD